MNNSVVVRADLVARLATRLVQSEVAGGLNTCGFSPSWEAEGRATAGGSGGFTWRSQTLQSPRAEVLPDVFLVLERDQFVQFGRLYNSEDTVYHELELPVGEAAALVPVRALGAAHTTQYQ